MCLRLVSVSALLDMGLCLPVAIISLGSYAVIHLTDRYWELGSHLIWSGKLPVQLETLSQDNKIESNKGRYTTCMLLWPLCAFVWIQGYTQWHAWDSHIYLIHLMPVCLDSLSFIHYFMDSLFVWSLTWFLGVSTKLWKAVICRHSPCWSIRATARQKGVWSME